MSGYFENREATEAVLKGGWLHTGDLGRLDSEGRLQLVGRKNDLILDASGRNVHPDELEKLYGESADIKELSIVGLPDDSGGEKVACLCVPDYKGRPRPEVRRHLEEHFQRTSAEIPFYRRVKILHLWDGELPKTSTRKVRRQRVVQELQRLERIATSVHRTRQAKLPRGGAQSEWLRALVAQISQRKLAEVQPESRLSADLGFDSLMLTELSVALEQASAPISAIGDLSQLNTVRDLCKAIAESVGAEEDPSSSSPERSDSALGQPKGNLARAVSGEEHRSEISVPPLVATLGRSLLGFGQRVLYGSVFDVQVAGKSFIPQNRNFLVVANHTSHLDMGLIKVVLGEQGERLTAMAARDYFFDTPLKRAYFENFTNLIPIDRHGSLRESLRLAGEALKQGYNLLVFPEGTRSPTGQLLEFKPTIGYLALTYRVDLLPLHLQGTYEALPKGAIFPKGKDLKVSIGPVLPYDELRDQTKGMARSESYRQVTHLAEEAVKALRDGRVLTLPTPLRRPRPERPRGRPLPLGEGGGQGRQVGRRRR
jgi:long-chain acyl-CoA synthetase